MPGRNATGTNTAASTSVAATMAPVTSPIDLRTASRRERPCSISRATFSTTTIASSTTSPIASTRPNRVTVFVVSPSAFMNANVPMSETGIVTAGIKVARQSCRKMNTTRKTRSPASTSVRTTSPIDSDTNCVGS